MGSSWQQSHQGPKEMTRNQHHSAANSTECFALCEQFIKNCHSYSGVKQTSTLLAGTHQHHEPANKLPAPSWTSQLFPFKLESTNTGSMGPSNRGWLPTGTYLHPPPNKSTTSNKMLTRKHGSKHHRGDRPDKKGAIIETQVVQQSFVSQIFLVEKKDGGQRPEVPETVCENRALQDGGSPPAPRPASSTGLDGEVRPEGCLPSGPNSPKPSTPPNLPVGGKALHVQCLPFGLSSAPRVFTKLLKPVVGFLRQIGCHLIIHLDDMLILHQNREQLHQITQLICQLLEALGLMVNQKKSITNPTQELKFLGFQAGSISMNLSIPSEKMWKIRQDARRMLDCPQVTVREVARFVGKAVDTLRAIPLAPLHYRALQMLMNSVLPLNYTQEEVNNETFLTLTTACKADLTWWVSLEQSHLGTPVCPPCPTVMVHSDASNEGWGEFSMGKRRQEVSGHWRKQLTI